jgi:endonuclease/exonuclease/phosphatase family metal-dependent hydrolase
MPTFTFMTWNVENLFRPLAGAPQPDQQRFQQKPVLLASLIHRFDPDAVALQEIGGEEPLRDLQQALGGSHPYRDISSFPDHRGIRVVFLMKQCVGTDRDCGFPARSCPADGSVPLTRMGRGALCVRLTKNRLTVDVITAHLKSKLLTFPRPGGGSSISPRDEDERAQVAGIALMRRMAEAVTKADSDECNTGCDDPPAAGRPRRL